MPVLVVPDPQALRGLLTNRAIKDNATPLHERSFDDLRGSGLLSAYAIYFSPTPKPNYNPTWHAPAPRGHFAGPVDSRYLGKAVGSSFVWRPDFPKRIKLATPVLAKRGTVELWEGVWLSELRVGDARPRREFDFPIADANGGARTTAEMAARPEARSQFENLVHSPIYQPTIGRQNLLIAPTPVAERQHASESVVLDEFFAREAVPVVLLCKAETWQPGKEDYRLEIGLDGLNAARDDIRLICVFTSIQPKDLLELFARLGGEDPAGVQPDAATLIELESLRAKALLVATPSAD